MNKSGFLLIEVLLGIAILGLISVTFLPIFNYTSNNFYLLEQKNQMKYYGESIMERLKSFNYDNDSQDYVLDMPIEDIMDLFYLQDYVKLKLPISEKYENNYYVKIEKENIGEKLWDVKVIIESRNNSERLRHVSYKSYLPKPFKK